MTDPMELVGRLEKVTAKPAGPGGIVRVKKRDLIEAVARIREMVDLVGGFVQAEDDAGSNPIGGLSLDGLMDCRDNSGCVYQSAHLAGLIEKARPLPLPPAPGAEDE